MFQNCENVNAPRVNVTQHIIAIHLGRHTIVVQNFLLPLMAK